MELLDLYDDNGKPIGKTIERGSKFDTGNVMLSIVFIKSSENKYLIQKTSEQKGSEFSSTGGHVTHGDNGLETIIREIDEELGLEVSSNELISIGLIKNPTKPCLIDLYLLNKDVNINDIKIQEEEVEYVKWMSREEILSLIDNGSFLASHGYLFKNYVMDYIK